jgi:hypothetical protein
MVELSRDGIFVSSISNFTIVLLEEAEKQFGLRSSEYRYDGLEISNVQYGLLFFIRNDKKYCQILISEDVILSNEEIYFHIGSRLVQVLSFEKNTTPNYLEIGCEIIFSKYLMWRSLKSVEPINQFLDNNRLIALDQVSKLLLLYPDAVIRLREFQPTINKISEEDFILAGIQIEKQIIRQLVSPFPYVE